MISADLIRRRNEIITEHRELILAMRSIEVDIEHKLSESDPQWKALESERKPLLRRTEKLLDDYWNWIPDVSLSRCPFCGAEMVHCFDPVDLKGFWWMDRTQQPCAEPSSCEHFRLLSGAVNLNGLIPESGPFECRPGPDAPFVIPRILERKGMTAVISISSMKCGYIAYPIAYFSEEQIPGGLLTQSWAQKEYWFTLDDGRTGWNIINDSYDFDLLPWLRNGKVRWMEGDRVNSETAVPEKCPFLNIEGTKKTQILIDNELRYE